MKTNIKPTIDCVFKAILGSLKKGNLIKKVTILNPYNEKEFIKDKLSIVDIKAQDESNKFYQLDVQVNINASIAERILYNWSCIYHSQLISGNDYTHLNPTTSIWLLEDTLYKPDKSQFDKLFDKYSHLKFKLYESELNFTLTDHLNIHILQLPFFRTEKSIKDDKDRWLYFFKEGHNLDIDSLPEKLNKKEIIKAMQTLQHFLKDQKAYLLYQERLEASRVESTWQSLIKEKNAQIQRIAMEKAAKDAQILKLQSLLQEYEDKMNYKP